MKQYKSAAFWTLFALLMYGLLSYMAEPANGQGRGDKRNAYQLIRDSSITLILLDPELIQQIVFESANGNAPIADSALALKNGVLTSGNFKSTSLDSLVKLLVDSADYARYLRNGAIMSRSAFSATAFDSLRGHPENNYGDVWVLYARNSRHADSSDYSNYSFLAGTAEFAQNYIGSNPVPEALHSLTSDYAVTALNALSQQGYFTTAQWDSIHDSVSVWVTVDDTVAVATEALTVKSGAVDSLSNFSTTVQDSYLVTKAYRQALNEIITNGAAKSSSNPIVDSTGMVKTMVSKRTVAERISIGFGNGVWPVEGVVMIDTSVAGNEMSIRTVSYSKDDTSVFLDSIGVLRMVNTASDLDSLDYVLKGTGGSPRSVTIASSAPSGVNGALWVDTTNLAAADTAKLKVYWDGAWNIVGGGGAGASAATEVYMNRAGGNIDADSLLWRSRPDTIIANLRHTAKYTNTDTIVSDKAAYFQRVYGDSNETIYIGDTITSIGVLSNRLFVGARTQSLGARPVGYLGYLNIGGSGVETITLEGVDGSITTAGSIGFSVDSTISIGSRNTSGVVGGDIASAPKYIIGHNVVAADSIYVSSGYPGSVDNSYVLMGETEGLELSGLPINVTNEGVIITNGNLQMIGSASQIQQGGSTWGVGGLSMIAGDSIGINTSGVLKLNEGAKLVVPSDSGAYFRNLADNTTYYLASLGEKNALRAPCPDLSGTNYVISKDWMKEFWTRRLWPTGLFKQGKDSLRAIYGAFKNPGCNDTIDFNSFDNAEFVWPVDTTAIPIEWPDTAQALILPWITPGIPIGPYWIDSTSNGIYYADPTPGYGEGILKVDQRTNDTLGFINGRYKTIKTALDSLVNFRCNVGSDSTLGTETGLAAAELDTFTLRTKIAAGNWMLKMYRGNVLVQDSIQQNLPDFITEAGAWVKFEKAGDAAQRWLQVECWLNDSVFTVRDSVIRAATIDSTWTLTFAKKQTILVYPPVDGQYINLPATCTIGDYCPVKIKGVDKNSVVITNKDRDPTPSVSQLFTVSGVTVNDTYLGMPIEFEDLTLYYEPIGGTVTPSITVAGNTKFTNCNMIIKSTGATTNPFVKFNYYDAAVITEANRPTLIVDNCVVIADSDVTVFELAADSVVFQSSNCSYSISGDDGIIVYASDVWGDDPPRFSRDDFFFGLSGTYLGPQGKLVETNQNPAGSSEKIPAIACVFIGSDPSTPANVLTIPSGSGVFKYSATLFWDTNDTRPPAKLRDGAIPVKPKWSPK